MVDFKMLIKILKRHWKLISISLVIGIGISAAITTVFVHDQYQGSVDIYTNEEGDGDKSIQQIVQTYQSIVYTPMVIDPLYDDLKKDGSFSGSKSELRNNIQIKMNGESEVFSLVASATTAKQATIISKKASEILNKKSKDVLPNNQLLNLSNNSTIITSIVPSTRIIWIIGAITGLTIGLVSAAWLELNNKKLVDPIDIEDETEFKVLAKVTLKK